MTAHFSNYDTVSRGGGVGQIRIPHSEQFRFHCAIRNPQLIAALKYLPIRNPQSEIRNVYLLAFSPTVPSTQSSVTRATE